MDPKTFRILSLDGGGIMGSFPASVLATFERETGKKVVDHFDLIAGTSTGGILAIGLSMGAGRRALHVLSVGWDEDLPGGGRVRGLAARGQSWFRPSSSRKG